MLLDTHEVCSFADYFVLTSAESQRQIQAVVDGVEDTLRNEGVRPGHIEGTPDSGWVLLDYGAVVVHVFSAEERAFYNLDELWSNARALVKII